MLHRKEIIEKRKEYLEQLNTERERLEKEAAEAERQKAMILEHQRLVKEAEERKKQKLKRELDEVTRKQTLDKIEQMKKTPLGQKALADLKPEELEELNPDRSVKFSSSIENSVVDLLSSLVCLKSKSSNWKWRRRN